MEKSGSPRSGTLVKASTCWRRITAVATPIASVAQSHSRFDGQSNTKDEARTGFRLSGPGRVDPKREITPRTDNTASAANATQAPDTAANIDAERKHAESGHGGVGESGKTTATTCRQLPQSSQPAHRSIGG